MVSTVYIMLCHVSIVSCYLVTELLEAEDTFIIYLHGWYSIGLHSSSNAIITKLAVNVMLT
jgi:hypothetical protein